jgi:hypothetical protein
LKVSLVETLLGHAVEDLLVAWWGGSVQLASSKGVAELKLAARGCHMDVGSG